MNAFCIRGVGGDHQEILGSVGKIVDDGGVPDRDVDHVGIRTTRGSVKEMIAENPILSIRIPSHDDTGGRGGSAEKA